jgi:hypothetical protein
MCERGVPGGAVNLNTTGYPDHGRYGDLPLKGNISTAKPEIEPGTSWLVVRSSNHQARGWPACNICNTAVWRKCGGGGAGHKSTHFMRNNVLSGNLPFM